MSGGPQPRPSSCWAAFLPPPLKGRGCPSLPAASCPLCPHSDLILWPRTSPLALPSLPCPALRFCLRSLPTQISYSAPHPSPPSPALPCPAQLPPIPSNLALCSRTHLPPPPPPALPCAAEKYGAAEIVDPRPVLHGSLLSTYKK